MTAISFQSLERLEIGPVEEMMFNKDESSTVDELRVMLADFEAGQGERLAFCTGVAEELPFEDNSFDTITSLEVLEHVQDPEVSVSEMARVASNWLLLSVPREPLWRGLNIARGAYLSELGNTPGHLNHWSRRSFVKLAARHGKVVEVCSPLPWTVLLVNVASLEAYSSRKSTT